MDKYIKIIYRVGLKIDHYMGREQTLISIIFS
jgi:hypothetical protein